MPGPDPHTLQPDEAEQYLFGDTLVSIESLPVQLVAVSAASSGDVQARAEWLLRLLGQIESGAPEHDEEHTDPSLRRIEAKLDLALDLLSSVLVSTRSSALTVDLRWSHLGVSFVAPQSSPIDRSGVLHLYLRSWLPSPLELPVRQLAQASDVGGERLWLAFQLDQPGLQRALDKLLFRQHRRHIAQTRREL